MGATSSFTTVEDLALWDENFYNPRVGGRALVESIPAQLEPAIKDLFTGSRANIRFVRDSRGRVSGFVLNRGRILNFRFRKSAAPKK